MVHITLHHLIIIQSAKTSSKLLVILFRAVNMGGADTLDASQGIQFTSNFDT